MKKAYICPKSVRIHLLAESLMAGSDPQVGGESGDIEQTRHHSGSSLWDNWNSDN